MPRPCCLFDLQVNGFAGVDFQSDHLDLGSLSKAVKALRKHGTQAILYTLVTDSIDALCRRLDRVEKWREQDKAIREMIAGYHLEGPWISKENGYHGAHAVDKAVAANLHDYARLRDAAGGNLKLITLAPEAQGTIEVIEAAQADHIRIGLGHTDAAESDIDDAIKAGATLATHLGNAVPEFLHRHDNVVQRLLARDELIACLIPDGIHLPPFVLKNFFRAKPAGKVFFTTDCMAAAGAPKPGRYPLSSRLVEVDENGVVHLPGDNRFAGSSLTMDSALENVINWIGLSPDEALKLCSMAPAEHFGVTIG